MADDERVLVNAGGRVFETCASTLKASGAGYFEALLGSTGDAMRGKKRARVSEDGAGDGRRELFVDRDPDLFVDVLRFMRANRLAAATKATGGRLEDLRVEAEFFSYDRLVAAVDEALAALEADEADRAPRSVFLSVEGQARGGFGPELEVDVPKGKVLYITSVVPQVAGRMEGILLRAEVDGKGSVIAGYALDGAPPFYLQHKMDLVIYPGEREKVVFDAVGPGWCVSGWIGHPSNIPGLAAK